MEFKFFSPSVDESWLVRLFVVDPLALDVFNGDVKVNATIGDRPTIASPLATNQLDPQLRVPSLAPSPAYCVRDLWARTDLGRVSEGTWAQSLAPHGAGLYLVQAC